MGAISYPRPATGVLIVQLRPYVARSGSKLVYRGSRGVGVIGFGYGYGYMYGGYGVIGQIWDNLPYDSLNYPITPIAIAIAIPKP